MSRRTYDRLHNRDNITARGERFRKSHQIGEYTDEFTTVEPEPWQVTLARLPKCLRKDKK